MRPDFNPRAPCGARLRSQSKTRRNSDFNPRAPCGARPPRQRGRIGQDPAFQSTRPMRGATTYNNGLYIIALQFQSTRPMRGATQQSNRPLPGCPISIHAPHAGRDDGEFPDTIIEVNFNPRAPCGARLTIAYMVVSARYFNPRAPCGARPPIPAKTRDGEYFNPRAPCGARPPTRSSVSAPSLFQSTRPMRGATGAAGNDRADPRISIHAPHAGRDWLQAPAQWQTIQISIHAPHAGRDASGNPLGFQHLNFNPRAPCGARPCSWVQPMIW